MHVENGATIKIDLSKYSFVKVTPEIEHPDAGETKDKTFFWYKWSDPTSRRTEDTEGKDWEDFTWGETINTLWLRKLEHARSESAGEYYQLDIQGKIVSSNWGPSYGWDGSPVYESGEQEYYLYVEVVEGQENLAYIAASDYAWFIENQPEKYGLKEIYPTAEELIEKYLLAVFGETTYLESDNWEGASLPIRWQLKEGTAYSAGKGAANTFVWSVSEEEYVNDVDLGNQLIGSDLYRPPYGRITRRQAALLSTRYHLVMGSVLSGDYNPAVSPERVLRNVTQQVRGGSIVVFHDSWKAFPRTRYALPRAIEYIRDQGYLFKTLSLPTACPQGEEMAFVGEPVVVPVSEKLRR